MLVSSQEVKDLPNIKSAIKRVRVTETRTKRNAMQKSALRTAVKKAKKAIEENSNSAQEQLIKAIKAIDKAAAKNLIHKNTAARKKSRLTKAFNAAAANK